MTHIAVERRLTQRGFVSAQRDFSEASVTTLAAREVS
jgi:hypothetical protein